MNHNCHGDYFTVKGKRYYCCLADSSVVQVHDTLDTWYCPECGREVKEANDHGECEIEVRTFVKIPERGTVEMPLPETESGRMNPAVFYGKYCETECIYIDWDMDACVAFFKGNKDPEKITGQLVREDYVYKNGAEIYGYVRCAECIALYGIK